MDEETVTSSPSLSSEPSAPASPELPKKVWSQPTMTVLEICDTAALVTAGAGDIEFTKADS